MLPKATDELLQTLRDSRANEGAINRAAQAWMKALDAPESLRQILDAQHQLASAIEWDDLERAQLALVMSGALVERGFAPEPLLEAFARHLPVWIEGANRLLEGALQGRDASELDEAAFEIAAARMPDEAQSWQKLELFYFVLIAALAVSPAAREQFGRVLPRLLTLAPAMESASYLVSMLRVLDNAPVLVIEPARKRGFVGSISGIADNWQLHALLMAHYPDAGAISERATAVFRGDGPQQIEQTLVGAWNLYDYHALTSEGRLPTNLSDSGHWIWNEDAPADIETFENYRTILLGPPAYDRGWPVRRLFEALRAEIRVERELEAEDVESWIRRLAT